MSYEVLIFLFIILSVVSSIVNKMKESRDRQQRQEDRPYVPLSRRGRPPVPGEEDEDAPPEWDVLQELERQRRGPAEPEFQEVHGTRPVSEEDTGPEFREVVPTRNVEEPKGVPEFREVRGTRHVTEGPPPKGPRPEEAQPKRMTYRPEGRRRRRRRRHGKLRLDLCPGGLRRAIVLNEILGPPRADQMPW